MVWPQIERFLAKLLAEDPITASRFTLADIRRLLAIGRARLWVAYVEGEYRGAMLTEIVQYPQCRECRIWFVAGEKMESWLRDWRATIEDFARSRACLRLATCGRIGWLRLFEGERAGNEMVKPLWGID